MLPWFHGNVENFLYGMQHVWTPMHLLTAELQHRRQGQLLTKLREGDPTNTQIWIPICTVVIETLGVFGKQTLSFLKDLACRVRKVSEEVKSFPYLLQRLAALFLRTVMHIN